MENQNRIRIAEVLIGFDSGSGKNILLPPLNASAEPGELVSVIGRNGIGKSTLMRTLAGLQKSFGGVILMNGKAINEYSGHELATITGFISTEPVKVSNMTVFDLVALGRFPYTNWAGSLTSRDIKLINDALSRTNMISLSGRYVAELSDGERQRAMIARLLAQDASIMIMDEPTAFLDILNRYEIMHLMHELAHSSGKTIVFTTHDLDLALRHSDRIWLILDDGIHEGAPEDLMLKRKFEELFNSSVVNFSSGEGIFTLNNSPRGSIYIGGSGIYHQWTIKAVIRAGFSVSPVKEEDYIEILPGNKWLMSLGGRKKEYGSIYSMVKDLNLLT